MDISVCNMSSSTRDWDTMQLVKILWLGVCSGFLEVDFEKELGPAQFISHFKFDPAQNKDGPIRSK
ncbi:hypothetical protein LINPERHAP1_LOCUS13396 [Linum perenne]